MRLRQSGSPTCCGSLRPDSSSRIPPSPPSPLPTPATPARGAPQGAPVAARQLASGAGVASGFVTITPPELLSFEPHQPELCGFVPPTFRDTAPVWDRKVAAREAMGAQSYLRQYYAERAGHRANH